MNLTIPNDNCDETWRVILASCWVEYRDYTFNPNGSLVRRPCDSVDCCSIGLKVCRFDGDPEYITTETLGGPTGGDSCINYTYAAINWATFGTPVLLPNDSVIYYQFNILQCQDKCNWLYGLEEEGYAGKRAIQDYDIKYVDYYGIDEIQVNVKVLENTLECNIVSTIETDNVRISISSIEGIQQKSIKNNILKGENLFYVDIKELHTGLYFINVIVNGVVLRTEKFIIIR